VENFQKYAYEIRENRLFQRCNHAQRYPQKIKKYPQIFRLVIERKFVDIEKMYDSIETGDINGDGMIDSSDASLVLAEYAKIQTGEDETFTKEQNIAADVNKDGVIDSSDASKILSYYAMVSTGKEPSWD
jgi:hypothetical protein